MFQERAPNKIPSKGLHGVGERKCSQLFFLCRNGRLNNCTSGEKANKLPIQAKISRSQGEGKQLEPIQPDTEVRAPKTAWPGMPAPGSQGSSEQVAATCPHLTPAHLTYTHEGELASFVRMWRGILGEMKGSKQASS